MPKYTHKKVKNLRKTVKKNRPHKIQLHTFPNHLHFLYENSPNPHLERSSIHIFGNFGSAQEPKGMRGLFHTIEHMIFNGTHKHTMRKLISHFDNIGAYFNAYTSKRLTCFIVECHSENTEECLDYLIEMLFDSIFPAQTMKKEQKVVMEENIQSDNDPDSMLSDSVDMSLFENTAYETPIDFVHPPLDRKKVLELYHQWYIPSNMAVSIVSSLSFDFLKQKMSHILKKNRLHKPQHLQPIHLLTMQEIEAEIDQNTTLRSKPGPDRNEKSDTKSRLETDDESEEGSDTDSDLETEHSMRHPNVKGFRKVGIRNHPHYHSQPFEKYKTKGGMKVVLIPKKDMQTIKMVFGVKTCDWESQDRDVFRMIKCVFRRGLSGRLIVGLREKYGLTYSPDVTTEYYDTTGKLEFQMEIECAKLVEYKEDGQNKPGLIPIFLKMIRDFIAKGVDEKEWKEVKGYLKGVMTRSSEHVSALSEYNGKNFLLQKESAKKKMVSFRDVYSVLLEPMDLRRVRDCIDRYFKEERMCLCLVGNHLPNFESLEKKWVL